MDGDEELGEEPIKEGDPREEPLEEEDPKEGPIEEEDPEEDSKKGPLDEDKPEEALIGISKRGPPRRTLRRGGSRGRASNRGRPERELS